MDAYINFPAKLTMFCSRGTNNRYREVEINDKERDRKLFPSHPDLHRFTRTSFSLKDVLDIFQRAVAVMLATMKRKSPVVYQDDGATFSETPDEHVAYVKELYTLLRNAELILKLSKYRFFTNTVN